MSNPQKPQSIDELVAIRQELVGLRKDLKEARKRYWLDIASGVAAALIVLSVLSRMIGTR
ncbi:hypothetical protein H6G97_03705 [Nostoc flagelliforme FACHB-838]|uniref:Uncharacterized protein n=1 Tax=Nostoc flagelliforme FACHB-838 TaxID=2692904 RepID=A0ABR8DGS7_9NOSO|nr:hypothetical protein [Nostoc flagelliforme]MBD2528714.1 hypothetical protein [Nostoc flagelliforme FACHB-838]